MSPMEPRSVVSFVAAVAGVWSAAGLLTGVAAGDSKCFHSGDIAGSVLGTFFVTLLLCLMAYFIVSRCHKSKGMKTRPFSSRENIRESDVDGGRYAYDNPYFHDDETDNRATPSATLDTAERGEAGPDVAKGNSTLEHKGNATKQQKKGKSSKPNLLSVLTNNKLNRHRALDDSCINLEPEKVMVPLRGIDFTGLGFNVCGNMRDGIFIKDVLHRGPAMESGKIKAGDRILSLTVGFTQMVYEDALTILSYASPYDVQLEIQKGTDNSLHHIPGHQKKGSNASNLSMAGNGGERVYHPLYRSHSIGDIYKLGLQDDAKRPQSIGISTAGLPIKPSNKKETLVRTSQSLREESSTDLQVFPDNSTGIKGDLQLTQPAHLGNSAEYSSTDSMDSDGKISKASRFQVRKVSEAGNEGKVNMIAALKVQKGDNQDLLSEGSFKSSSSDGESKKASEQSPVNTITFKPEEVMYNLNNADTLPLNKELDIGFQPTSPMTETYNQSSMDQLSRTSSSSSSDSKGRQSEPVNMEEIQFTISDSNGHQNSSPSAPIPAKRNTVPGKRKAPPPPASMQLLMNSDLETSNNEIMVAGGTSDVQQPHITMLKVSPDIHAVPSWVTRDGQEQDKNLDSDKTVAIQTNFSSDSSDSSSEDEENKANHGALGDTKMQDLSSSKNPDKSKRSKDKNRRATSLGDLTTVQETGQKSFPLERSVSMDLNQAGALPVQGQLGLQREQIHNKLAMVGENGNSSNSSSDEMLAPQPLKKHNFTARENLHLVDDGSEKGSWEDVDKNHSEDEDRGTDSPILLNLDTFKTVQDLSILGNENVYDNSFEINEAAVLDDPNFFENKFNNVSISASDKAHVDALPLDTDTLNMLLEESAAQKQSVEEDENMSDVSLSDRELSDVMSSMSDDSIGAKKKMTRSVSPPTEKVIIKKMIPVTVTKEVQSSSSSSSSESDDESHKPPFPTSESIEMATSTVIHHDEVTGSSLVTIGSPVIASAKRDDKIHNSANSDSAIDPQMAKLFNNVTVSNTSKEPITLDIENWTVVTPETVSNSNNDTKNGSHKRLDVGNLVSMNDSDDEGSLSSHNGNGTTSPISHEPEQQFETTLQMDVSGNGDSTRHENKFGLISFETSQPVPLQKSTENLYSNYTVSEGTISRAVIISNPQLSSPVMDNLASDLEKGLESPPPTLEPPPE